VVVVLACLIASDTWLFRSGQVAPASEYVVSHPVSVLVLLGLTLLSTLFHECGHAAACRYGGVRPGVIGMGFDTLEALGRKKGSGLILDMGRRVSVSSVMIKFGRQRGADVSIEVGNHDAPVAARLSTFRTVGRADGIGGPYTIKVTCPVRGRYVLVRFTKLPSAGAGRFAAGTFNIVIRGSA
jgi:hypothetical protein